MHVLSVTDLDLREPNDPRITDIKLAAALGYGQPRKIRQLIERHRSPLEELGTLRATVARYPDTLGRRRKAMVFSLSRKQALYICTKAETPQATSVTLAIVEVFDTVVFGGRNSHQNLLAVDGDEPAREPLRVRNAKMRLAEAVGTLDALGVDVARIDIRVVRDFWRQIAA